MARDADKAIYLKNEGNNFFKAGDYVAAESYYTKAIIADDANSALYTNRAMARLKLELWDSVIADCEACLNRTDRRSMKAFFYLSQAQYHLGAHEEALACAQRARELCAETGDRSLAAVTAQVLACRKARWDALERRRARENRGLEDETVELMREQLRDEVRRINGESGSSSGDDSGEGEEARSGLVRELEEKLEEKIRLVREVFDKSRADDERERHVPEWGIDDISYNWMIDPVMTKTGKSYERASIEEHVRRHKNDPLTREPLSREDLRPNLSLRYACEEFMSKNGWVADW